MDLNQTHVDLHILVVPDSQWRPDLHLAYSNACMSSVSAGFVRVDPSVCLDKLRGEISRQLDSPLLPQSYVFLRIVGNHLCTVSRNQELCLTAKLFVPPLAACPDMYLLNAVVTGVIASPVSTSPTPAATPRRTKLPPLHHSFQDSSSLSDHHSKHRGRLTDPHSNDSGTILSNNTLSDTSSRHTHHLYTSDDSHGTRHKNSVSHQTGTRSSLLQLSDKSRRFSSARSHDDGHHTGSSVSVPPDVLRLEQEQQGFAATQLQHNHEEDYRGHPQHISKSSSNDDESSYTQSVKKRSVHFENFSHTSEDHNLSSPDLVDATDPSSSLPHDTHSLLALIRKTREESKHLGVLKDSLSTTVRQLQRKLQSRKEREESEWKQKLADEMKRTKTLEKSIQRLRTEIEAGNQTRIKQHSVKKSAVRDERQKNTKSVTKSESDHTNMKMECKRADADMSDLRKSLEQEKRKLKVEQETHQSIVEECKVLKKELNQLKITHNRRV